MVGTGDGEGGVCDVRRSVCGVEVGKVKRVCAEGGRGCGGGYRVGT